MPPSSARLKSETAAPVITSHAPLGADGPSPAVARKGINNHVSDAVAISGWRPRTRWTSVEPLRGSDSRNSGSIASGYDRSVASRVRCPASAGGPMGGLTDMKIAYLVGRYPAVSHTFILREVGGLRARGVDIETISIHRVGADQLLTEAERQEFESTYTV